MKPLRYIEVSTDTIEKMREEARNSTLYQEGDMKLVWVNEGDLHDHSTFFKDPRKCPIGLDASPYICSAGSCVVCLIDRAYSQGVAHARFSVENHYDWNPSTVREDILLNIDMNCTGFVYQGKTDE